MGTLVRLMMGGYYAFLGGLALFFAAALAGLVMLFLKFPWPPLAVPFVLVAVTLGQLAWAGRVLFMKLDTEDPLEVKFPKKLLKPVHTFVRNIAGELKLPEPDEIRICAHDAAYVKETDDGSKVLVLGGMILGSYTQEGLAGVVAHELAHFDAGDTALTRQSYRTGMLMGHVEYQFFQQGVIALWNPLVWFLRGYHYLFALVHAAHSREQEYKADEATVELVGKERAAATLMRLELTESIPWLSIASMAEAAAHTGQPMTRIFKEQRQRAERISAGEWKDAFDKAMSEDTGWFASHPCLRERLDAIGVSPKKALTLAVNDDGPSCRALFPNWDEVETELSVRLMAVFGEIEMVKREIGAILTGRPM